MYLLTVTMYEFGQFLRILLWISLPMAVIAVLVTTYLHYRNKRLQNEWEGNVLLSGIPDGHSTGHSADHSERNLDETGLLASSGEAAGNSTYQGLLWMKEKYEEYRVQMDLRYEKLKEELEKAEKKYLDLLDGNETSLAGDGARDQKEARVSLIEKESARGLVTEKNAQISFLQHQLDERIKSYHELEYQGQEDRNLVDHLRQLVEEKEQMIREQEQLLEQKNTELAQKEQLSAGLMEKLENNSRLLMSIYKELDHSLKLDHSLDATLSFS